MKMFIFFCFLFTSIASYSQSMVKLFEDFIPSQLMKNTYAKETAELSLNYYAELHPDLIYYYLTYLDKVYNNKITNPDSNYSKLLRYNRNIFLIDRASWASKQISNIDSFTDLRLKRNSMENHFEPLVDYDINEVNEVIPLFVDNNLLEFFNYTYFTKSKSDYDNTKNYFVINKEILSKNVTKYEEEYQELGDYYFDDQVKKVERDIANWYLIGAGQSNKYQCNTIYEEYEATIKIYDKLFFTKSGLIFSASVNVFGNNNTSIESGIHIVDKPLPTFIHPISYRFRFRFKYQPRASLELGYQFVLKPELKIFSHIKAKVGYSFIKTETDDESKGQEFYKFVYLINSGTDKSSFVYKVNSVQNIKSNFGYFEAVTPVFYLNKKIYCEIGFDVSYKHLTYDYQIVKQIVRENENQKTTSDSEFLSKSFVDESLIISPSVAINYEIYENLNFSITASYMYDMGIFMSKISYLF